MFWRKRKVVVPQQKSREPQTFAEIIAPMAKIKERLENHVAKMDTRKEGLEMQRTMIEDQIKDALQERASAENAAVEMKKFVEPIEASINDEDGMTDESDV